ncbi:NAD(P)/FAD-dependent oxidoreductase [Microvirga sp. W0021]|uniref:NAD(P)/FAD-dependent oxidoreductase n=1 Tax=Hohaiivirga grylli TaxID=3133970 RepID=A0ABV0BLK7_9HYPH
MDKNTTDTPTEYYDVLIIGAGISGIAAAHHLQEQCPDKSFAILEAKESFGGTWLTHKYPGVRSDSDLHTFGYRFKPWTGAPIATGDEILAYMKSVIDDDGLQPHIRYQHTVESASWSSEENLWTITARRSDTGQSLRFKTHFLWMCQGYYQHAEGYTPQWQSMSSFKGQIIHPQTWPEDLETAGKKIVVIGSGATAATLIPALAGKCAHVTMLQRSPTWFTTGRNANAMAEELRLLDIDESWVHEITRRKVLRDQALFVQRTKEEPEKVKSDLLAVLREHLGNDFDIDTHFTPRYRPWQQRVAFIPEGDLFKAVREGLASVVTDEIDSFTTHGIQLKSGKHLDADIIVTATGFNLSVLGDISFTIDGEPLNFGDTITYRGMMFTGLPNMVWVFGYFRASWTLRSDMVGDFVCKLLKHMDANNARKVTTELRPEDEGMTLGPWIHPEDFNPGYLARGMHLLPKQGNKREWQHTHDYWLDKDDFPAIDLNDPIFSYAR